MLQEPSDLVPRFWSYRPVLYTCTWHHVMGVEVRFLKPIVSMEQCVPQTNIRATPLQLLKILVVDVDSSRQCYTVKEHCVLYLEKKHLKSSAFSLYVHFVKKTFQQVIYFLKYFKFCESPCPYDKAKESTPQMKVCCPSRFLRVFKSYVLC